MLFVILFALFLVLVLLSSFIFITGSIVAARSDEQDEQLYGALLTTEL